MFINYQPHYNLEMNEYQCYYQFSSVFLICWQCEAQIIHAKSKWSVILNIRIVRYNHRTELNGGYCYMLIMLRY